MRWLLLVAACGMACRREAKSPQRQMQFQVGATVPHHFEELAADRTRLWITTDAGVITIDPVAERWTTVYADSQPLGRATVVPCDSRIWLQRSDTVLLADPEGQRFEIRTLGPSETPPSRRNIQTRCASKGLWIYDTGRLVHVPLAAGTTSRYDVPPLGERASVNDFVDTPTGVYLLAYVPQTSGRFAFARFDTATKSVTQIALPTGPGVYGFRVVGRADDRVLLQTYDRRVFAMQGAGESWSELPPPGGTEKEGRGGELVLAHDNGIVWIGASYDASPASYFVLRYIKDAMEPRDLVVLPDYYTRIRSVPRSVLQHLGMLWIASDSALLRIDPASGELVRYRPRPGGALDKQAFHLTQEKGVLKYFDGDSLRTLTENGIPPEPAASDTTASDTTDQAGPDSLPPAKLGKKAKS